MADTIRVPIKKVGTTNWGRLSTFGLTHFVCAEEWKVVDQNFSFAGQHRVRKIKLRKNVHWEIPDNVDISGVEPAEAPRRQQGR
jgi:hypothetical protein